MRGLLASPLGLLVGLSLGALGGGGSILAVPALVLGAGETAQAATTTSSAVSRAAGQLTRSSKRAEAQPKSRWRSFRWPIMESAVLTAL